MVTKDNIKLILDSTRPDWQSVSEHDIAFAILCDAIDDKALAYRLAYKKSDKDAEKFYNSNRFCKLKEKLEPFGISGLSANSITKEQNKSELIKLLDRVKYLSDNKGLDPKDAIKLEGDLRVKLNDKFEMDESQRQKRIIRVPTKHDIVCPNTNMECNFWPSKVACMRHYNLVESKTATGKVNKDDELNNIDSDE